MMDLKSLKLAIILLSIFLLSSTSNASINLSINPIGGGNSLRFGSVDIFGEANREVKIRISSAEGTKYQVFQRIVEPLSNEKGQSLRPDSISTYSISGSNSSGTLYLQNMENLGLTDQLIYSSSSGGESDSFTMVYSARKDRISFSGNFFGKIVYTVRPIGSSSFDDAYLNVYLESKGEVKVEVEGSSSKESINLSSEDQYKREGYSKISFSGNPGNKINIYQEIEIFPQDETFEELNKDIIKFTTSGNTQGELYYKNLSDLNRKRILLYSSDYSEDSFFVNFVVSPEHVFEQKAGKYSGRIKYIFESDEIEKENSLDIKMEIKPVFNLEVDLPPEGLKFSKLIPESPPQYREVKVKVKTNIGRPYTVTQKVFSPLTNKKGKELEEKYFNIKGELIGNSTGKIIHNEFKPVPKGDMPIFISDRKGNSAEFKIIYRLSAYASIDPGDYSTQIVYSLGEM